MSDITTNPLTGLWLSKSKYRGKVPKQQYSNIEEELKTQPYTQIHTRPPKIPLLPVTAPAGFYVADILFFDNYSKWNQGYKMILNIIDPTSKYLYAYPLKSKADTLKAFEDFVVKANPFPTDITTDAGKEFVNNKLKEFFAKNKIVLHDTKVKTRVSTVERVNRTIRELITRLMTINKNYKWVEFLPDIIQNYNTTDHSSLMLNGIPHTPTQVNNDMSLRVQKRINQVNKTREILKDRKQMFPVGAHVRIKRTDRATWEKGAEAHYSTAIYKIVKDLGYNTYELESLESPTTTMVVPAAGLLQVSKRTVKSAPVQKSEPLPSLKQLKKQKSIAQAEAREGINKANIKQSKRQTKPSKRLDL